MKKRLHILLCLCVLLHAEKSTAQDTTSKFSVVVSPALFVPVSIAAQGGIQYRINNRWSFLLEAAYPTFYPKNTEYEEINYWRTGLEVRYRISRKTLSNKYISLQANYLFRELKNEEQAVYYSKTQGFSYSNAEINSPVLSTALKLGFVMNAGKRTFIDAFFGAGVRFIMTEYKTKIALVTSILPPRQTFFTYDDAWLYNYTLVRFHATGGIRFGIRL